MRHLSLAILAGLALPGVAWAADPPCHSEPLILERESAKQLTAPTPRRRAGALARDSVARSDSSAPVLRAAESSDRARRESGPVTAAPPRAQKSPAVIRCSGPGRASSIVVSVASW
jgi:hypothetical protein